MKPPHRSSRDASAAESSDALSHEFAARIGYRFRDRALLRRALTHRSCAGDSNERMEHLGDSLLGFVIAEALFTRFPAADEGALSRMRAKLVSNHALAEYARALALPSQLRLGASARRNPVGGASDSILAGAVEALIGAIYLDSDWPAAAGVVRAWFAPRLAQASPFTADDNKDDKTRLQEHLQRIGQPLPRYEVVAQSGKPHAPVFTVACSASALDAPVTAVGDSRSKAEQAAARRALALLRARD